MSQGENDPKVKKPSHDEKAFISIVPISQCISRNDISHIKPVIDEDHSKINPVTPIS